MPNRTKNRRTNLLGNPPLHRAFELSGLEPRLLMAAHPHTEAWLRHHTLKWIHHHSESFVRHHYELDASPTVGTSSTVTSSNGSFALSSVPVLNSRPGA